MGWVYNLDKPDPHSEISQVIAVLLVFTIAALLAVALRFYIRIHTKRALWLDDYAALYSAIMTAGYCASSILREWPFMAVGGGWIPNCYRNAMGSRSPCRVFSYGQCEAIQ